MSKLSQNIIILLLIIFTVSCEKDLYISDSVDSKLVVNSILKVNDTIRINLSKTRNILDPADSIDWVRNADVYLRIDDNKFTEKLTYRSDGFYSSSAFVGEYSKEYELEISHPNYENVFATAKMPDKPLGAVTFIAHENGTTNNSRTTFEIEITNKSQNKYFIWEMFNNESQNPLNIVSLDMKTDNILPDFSQSPERIFINASKYDTETLNSPFSTTNLVEKDIQTAKVRLITVNEDMYNYYKSLELFNNSTVNQVEPIEIFTNIENGLGIFGAVAETVLSINQ